MPAHPNESPMSDPLAYFLTWPTYGTWLPGDERGWVLHGKGFQPPSPIRQESAERRMTESACLLDTAQRGLVEKTICDHCKIRQWHLYAVNCRSNHVHIVVAADRKPEVVRDQFKAWCSRKLNELQQSRNMPRRKNWWTERASRRYLGDEDSLETAIKYVLEAQ